MVGTSQKGSSAKKASTTSALETTPARSTRAQSEVISKYRLIQQEFSQIKRRNDQRVTKAKEHRISQLESQIRENQNLVWLTLEKWKKAHSSYTEEIERLQLANSRLTEWKNKQSQNSQLLQRERNQKDKLVDENKQLKAKLLQCQSAYLNLKSRRKAEKQQWKALASDYSQQIQALKAQIMKLPASR